MTREEAKELLPIMQAYAEGKVIESFDDVWGWVEMENPKFDLSPEFYRIKPEQKYRPFKTQEECWKEMLKHQPFGWIRSKHTKISQQIETIAGTVHFNRQPISYPDIFNNWEFTDGSPFGIKIENV